jgi:hypothetical protein
MELEFTPSASTTAKYHGFEAVQLTAGEELSLVAGMEELSESVPRGKRWNVRILINITETEDV